MSSRSPTNRSTTPTIGVDVDSVQQISANTEHDVVHDPKGTTMIDTNTHKGARIYSKLILGFYDQLVISFSNRYAWRCPSQIMLNAYNRLTSTRHLDVGPGTGWYLDHAQLPAGIDLTLFDLNRNSLESASARIASTPHTLASGDILALQPDDLGTFDSISANYLLHCLPGTWQDKTVALRNITDHLDDDGVLFGATILGTDVDHNLPGRGLMRLYNQLGIFHNTADDIAGLANSLESLFNEVTVRRQGTVALFEARHPVRG